LIRGSVLSSSPDSWMDRSIIKPKKITK
jgi:hypothetical protein